MSIDLTAMRTQNAAPEVQDFGGVLTPALGGATQHIDRAGTRWALTVTSPTMPQEPQGRLFAADMVAGKRGGVLVRVTQPNFEIGAPGSPVIASDTPAGRSLPLAGLTPGYAIRKGQWISIVHAGRRYLDMATAQSIAASDGTATVTIQNLIRVPLSAGDAVELASPKIEGSIPAWTSWAIDEKRMVQFSFRVAEDE